ncbi:hypothetical protein [Rhizobacter sp. Root404]|uniref:hypothetical protein n=1 Tax=Rhizobacter sp. Root404 TaxID=1736528 RepID=UPI0006F86B9D|nr:hypothetical protein [Rhizobacter sp. Root404]KQW38746.1 hypothetical protein ASC76_12265 [Rhizobacter sp. Root404]
MKLRHPSSRWALWAFAAALLLKSAMPWLANASAQMQGKTLVEVCTLYGVALVPQGQGQSEPTDHPADHASAECALTALTVLAQIDPPARVSLPAQQRDAAPPRAHRSSRAPDACASWVARLQHGPPAFA